MPKKRNFLGGMQNYDPKTGEYEPDLKGPDGERPSSFGNFKKGDEKKSQHDKINAKRMGEDKDLNKTMKDFESDDDYFDWYNSLSDEEKSKHLWEEKSEPENFDKLPEDVRRWLKRNEDAYEYEIEAPSNDDTIYFKTINKETGDEVQYSWNERTGITDHTNNEHFGSFDNEDKSFEAINEKRMNGKENLKNKIEEWKKNNPDGKVEENVDIESLKEKQEPKNIDITKEAKKYKHGGIAGELEGLDFTMDKVDEENQTLEFKGKRGNYKIIQSKDNPANYETYLNDELVMKGQGSAYIAENIKKYDSDDGFVERVKAKNKELDNTQDKSFGNINKKRMGNDNLPF